MASKTLWILILLLVAVIGTAFFFSTRRNNVPALVQTVDQTADWKIYTNTKYNYIIKYPSTLTPIEIPDDVIYLHHVEFKDPKVTSMSGITVEVRNLTTLKDEIVYRKWQVEGHLIPGKIDSEEPITISGLSGTILNYTSGEEKFSIAIVPYQKFVYTITAQSNQLQLYNQLLSTFKFINNPGETAIKILQAVPEIQIIENAVMKNGRKTLFTQGNISGDIVTVWLYEEGFPDQHTTKIDTFNVNVKSGVITVDDVAMKSGQETITLDEWKKTIKERFQ